MWKDTRAQLWVLKFAGAKPVKQVLIKIKFQLLCEIIAKISFISLARGLNQLRRAYSGRIQIPLSEF